MSARRLTDEGRRGGARGERGGENPLSSLWKPFRSLGPARRDHPNARKVAHHVDTARQGKDTSMSPRPDTEKIPRFITALKDTGTTENLCLPS